MMQIFQNILVIFIHGLGKIRAWLGDVSFSGWPTEEILDKITPIRLIIMIRFAPDFKQIWL